MVASAEELAHIEELRQELYRQLGPSYSPEAVQALAPISREIDRLVVRLLRSQAGEQGGVE